jgi:DNA-directed RNA polymerase subunit P
MYRCVKCGKDIEINQVKEKIRCPYCGYKIIIKETPKTIIKVKAD